MLGIRTMRPASAGIAAALLGLFALTGCGASNHSQSATVAPPVPTSALPPGRPALPQPAPETGSAGLLAPLQLSPGPGGAARQLSSVEFSLDGAQYTNWSGAPSGPAPGKPGALRLVADATHQMAYAAYDLAPASDDYACLPKRLHIAISAAPAGPDAAPLPLEYYVGVPNYSATQWHWLGPFTTAYEPLINSAGQRDRYFDLSGTTTVLVALAAAADGTPRAADLASVGYSTAEPYYPVKPYRLNFTAGYLSASIMGYSPWTDGSYLLDTYAALRAAAGTTSVFQDYGFTSFELKRLDPGSGQFVTVGTSGGPAGDPLVAWVVDPGSNLPTPLLPGDTTSYALRLINAVGSTPLTATAVLTTPLASPALTAYSSVGAISLAWTRQYGVEGFELYRDDALLAAPDAATANYFDQTAAPGVIHTYRVRAIRGTDFADSAPVTTAAAYLAPQWVTLQPNPSGVHLAWSMAYPPDGFELYRDDVLLQSFTPDVFSYDDTGVAPLHEYTYVLRATFTAAEHLETPPTAVYTWQWPAYFLAAGGIGDGEGQLIDLDGHPALVAGQSVTGAPNDSHSQLSIFEAGAGVPASAADWTVKALSVPTFEPQGQQAQSLTPVYTSFCNFLGQPVCAMHSEFASWDQFSTVLCYRQDAGLPPQPPDTLEWLTSYAPTDSLIEDLSLASIGGRLAMAWRDDYTLKIHFARALVSQPEPSTDWQISPVVAGSAEECALSELGGTPALLVRLHDTLQLYRSIGQDPPNAAAWTHSDVVTGLSVSSSSSPLLQTIQGLPWITYYDHALQAHCFARATMANPLSPADWVVGQLYPETNSQPGPARFAAYNGRIAAVYADERGRAWLALSADATPTGPADWTRTLLDPDGGGAPPSVTVSNGQLYISFDVGQYPRVNGWHIMLPPAGI